jgi:hypothetical protein
MERSEPVIGDVMPRDVLVGWRYDANGNKVGGEWRRPNYEADCRNLGRWPSVSAVSIWTPELWKQTANRVMPLGGCLQIGVDVARFGNCNTSFAIRCGANLLDIESYNGWNNIQIAEHAKKLCFDWGLRFNVPTREVPVVIDGTGGWGGGVEDIGLVDGYNFMCLIMGETPLDPNRYVLMRDELWCNLREVAEEGKLSFKMLSQGKQDLIRVQALAAKYEYRGLRKKVLPKEEMAEALNGRSPDEFESVLLAFADVTKLSSEKVVGRVA